METKKLQVHMIPTDNAMNGCILKTPDKLINHTIGTSLTQERISSLNCSSYQLYFTSDEKIKEGDWCYDIENKVVFQFKHFNSGVLHSNNHSQYEQDCRKIIATTDKLCIKDSGGPWYEDDYLPQPSQAFIEKYCKVGGIDEVLVEYKTILKSYVIKPYEIEELKVNSNNEIIIHPIKNSWNREEVIKLINDHTFRFEGMKRTVQELEDWIKENL